MTRIPQPDPSLVSEFGSQIQSYQNPHETPRKALLSDMQITVLLRFEAKMSQIRRGDYLNNLFIDPIIIYIIITKFINKLNNLQTSFYP